MEARKLNRRVRVERQAVTVDGTYNSDQLAWVTHVDKLWASIEDAPVDSVNAEVTQAEQRDIVRKATVEIRWRADITTEMRLVDIARGRTLQIVNVAEIGRRDGLAFACEEYAAR